MMHKTHLNQDAYSLLTSNLGRIRSFLRQELRAAHGDAWPGQGLPPDLYAFLEQRRSREATINWHLSDECDVLDYAGFGDLYGVIAGNPDLLTRFLPLAPDANVLHFRFLELQTILNRVAYHRPVAESEMGFLISFEERLRRITDAPAGRHTSAPVPPAATPGPPAAPNNKPSESVAAAATAPVRSAPATTLAPPVGVAQPPLAGPPATTGAAAPAPHASIEPAAGDDAPVERLNGTELAAALAGRNDRAVLDALYREVTMLADSLWSEASTPSPRVWEEVRESDWYREKFSALGLKPISDFYSLVDDAGSHTRSGMSRTEMQEYLKERGFAQLLLNLRDMFKQRLSGAKKA